jgi:tripartite-type tricarboxylate transporter receptor subunit TctC
VRRRPCLNLLTLSLLLSPLATARVRAQPQGEQIGGPEHEPMRLIVPFPVGGTSDRIGRRLADLLGREIGQRILVDNIGGAGGSVGVAQALRQPADGRTLILGGIGQNAIAHALPSPPSYDSRRDLIALGLLHVGANVLLVRADSPLRHLEDLIAEARRRPGQIQYAYTPASSGHMATELLRREAARCPMTQPGCTVLPLAGQPYRGGGRLLQDLVDGRVGLLFVNLDSAMADLRARRVRALAVSSAQRHPLLPEVPTLAESGLPGFEVLSWSGLMVARGTPAPVVERLEAALRRVMASAEMQRAMHAEGLTLPPAGAEAHAQLLAREITRWQRLVRESGIMTD